MAVAALLPLKGRVFKIGILKISGSALAAEICTDPHNRLLRGIALERGSYSRIGACPYLSPQLINSRFCPCKGRISLAGLAPQ